MKQFIKLTSQATGRTVCINASKIEWFERDTTNTETSGTAVWTSADACAVVKESPEHVEAAIEAAISDRGPSPLASVTGADIDALRSGLKPAKATEKINGRLLCLRYAALRIAEAIIAGKTVIVIVDEVEYPLSAVRLSYRYIKCSLEGFVSEFDFYPINITGSTVTDSTGEILYEPKMLEEAEREPKPIPAFSD